MNKQPNHAPGKPPDTFVSALDNRAGEWAVIPTTAISFSPDIVRACEMNICGSYNKCWTCPPAIGSPEDQQKKILAYSSAFIFTTTAPLEDSFDYEGMARAKDYHDRLTAEMREKCGAAVYGAGACTVCESCAWPEPCRFPDKAYPSIEAAGIDVTELSRAGNIRYNNGTNTVTYFSMILFDQK
jgi:predicted metal-binding protein